MKPLQEMNSSWKNLIAPVLRFELVMNDEAVLDHETGLVWQVETTSNYTQWGVSVNSCYHAETGGRAGWRLPTIEELMTLVDTNSFGQALPAGHPFSLPSPMTFWAITSSPSGNSAAYFLTFEGVGAMAAQEKLNSGYAWCVRGGRGPDPMPHAVE